MPKVAGFILSLFLANTLGTPAMARDLVLGSISDDPVKEVRTFLPLTRYLAENLSEEGFTGAKVYVGDSISDISDAIKDGKIDIFMDSPLVVLSASQKTLCPPRLRRWKDGQASYHTVFITRPDNTVESLDSLKGKIIAFDKPSSTSGYILPYKVIAQAGLPLKEVQWTPAPPEEQAQFSSRPLLDYDAVNYTFSGHDENTLTWVLYGLADVGAISNIELQKLTGTHTEQVKVIHRSPEIPRHAVCVNSQMAPDLQEKILTLLKNMHRQPTGRLILEKTENTKKFDDVPNTEMRILYSLFATTSSGQAPLPTSYDGP